MATALSKPSRGRRCLLLWATSVVPTQAKASTIVIAPFFHRPGQKLNGIREVECPTSEAGSVSAGQESKQPAYFRSKTSKMHFLGREQMRRTVCFYRLDVRERERIFFFKWVFSVWCIRSGERAARASTSAKYGLVQPPPPLLFLWEPGCQGKYSVLLVLTKYFYPTQCRAVSLLQYSTGMYKHGTERLSLSYILEDILYQGFCSLLHFEAVSLLCTCSIFINEIV